MAIRTWATALAAAALASCAQAPAPETAVAPKAAAATVAAGERPALWKLADEDTTIYLFGTIHMLPEGVEWRSATFDEALAASDMLVLETLLSPDPTAAAATMMKLGLTPGLPPLVERVPAERRAELEALVKETGVPMAVLDRMESWAAGLTLLAVSFQKMGFDPKLGVETVLAEEARGEGRKMEGLETVEQQLGFFDALSQEAQDAFLLGILDSPQMSREEFEKMVRAWRTGDVDAIAETFDSETALSPELREVLMRRRNAAWTDWLAERLETPGTVMVAVGAGHLAGRDSVQTMLKARGLGTTRIQ